MHAKECHSLFRTNTQHDVSILINDLAAGGRPVTCMVIVFLPWLVDIANQHGIPFVFYWIQAATIFATYYHFFHGFESLIQAHAGEPSFTVWLPGLMALQIKDLSPFLTVTDYDSYFGSIVQLMREMFEILDREQERNMKPRVLINTFKEWETDALVSVSAEIETIPVGLLSKETNLSSSGYLFKEDEKKYMEWLDSKEEGSVVYISFGSMSVMKKEQIEEMVKGLKESKRPYLWVLRKDNREKELVEIEGDDDQDGNEMMVEWCSQVRVLAHKAVGCFVTHSVWNSTLESLACGVPMVCVPQWIDQGMNAKLVESLWGCGVRSDGDGDGDGVVKGEELVRCLELVMGDGEKGVEIRRKAKMWKDKALEAVSGGESSDANMKVLVEKIK
ncbi:cyanidin 3-O-rutinoside 5-O-glucosyltransferase-like [Dioscorea cayenensis subsp. rotundata]|uniref:Cyanidin 3-O-rutinoside 5-O-glucosyltransferase-like n=1 Tax=Dioscorea cayennensis subsp. rotundata TaxID=55577 RepID=A0AB40CTI1_DIOCR|nr:cyanidin 3-O-rutinoside 5-O-glucosyltransferase-like [Dioscorea cayenensis subsp. rotundata]